MIAGDNNAIFRYRTQKSSGQIIKVWQVTKENLSFKSWQIPSYGEKLQQRWALQGPEIIAFVREQQDIAREERRMQRKDTQAQAATDVAQVQAQREHELEVLRLRGNRQQDQQNERSNTKTPKLPSFVEGKDEIDIFIQRFERYARANGWAEENWAILLGALLTGKTLEAYTRLSEDASNYVELKNSLLKRYNLTPEGYHGKFQKGRPEME